MTVSQFKDIARGSASSSVWVKTPGGNNYPVNQESFTIVVDFDLDLSDFNVVQFS